jgi:ATP-binding cassette subfamily B protein
MVWETSPALSTLALLLRLIASAVPVAQLWVGKLIIDQIVHPRPNRSVWILVAIQIAIVIVGDLLARGISLSDSLLGDRFTNHIGIRLMEHAGKLDLATFEDPVFYDKLERARRQTTARMGMLAQLAGMLQQLITLVSLSGAVIWFSPWLFVLLVAALVPSFLGETRFAMLAYSILFRWTPERREMDYLRLLGASNQSAKEVKIFGLQGYLIERSRTLFERFYDENRGLAIRRAFTGFALNLLPVAGYYAAYLVIIARTIAGRLTLGDLTFLAGAFARSRQLMENLFSQVNGIAEQALYIKDLFDFFQVQPRVVSTANPIPAPRPIQYGFEFRNVSFAYAGSDRLVLHDVSFRLDAGEKIALIGENGAGKTTIVKLLSRLYDPRAGSILLDGVDLREYDLDDLRREVGVIFQDYMRFDMLARENIGVGRIESLSDADLLHESARRSLADQVIRTLPKGFDQMLGRRFDDGVDLSAGQWQKIALARAYMRDAQLIILDEPTASLDARAEYEVFQRFAELTRGKMAVLISHRFSTVRMADRILVLEQGRIVEQGSHDQLLRRGGQYSELFELQAAGYR